MDIMDSMDIIEIMDIFDIMDIMDGMDIMDTMYNMDIMNITAWMALAGAVLALVFTKQCISFNIKKTYRRH